MKHEMDATDCEIRDRRREIRDGLWGPRIGDFVRMLDGTTQRFTHDWGDDIQTGTGGNYYLPKSGHASYSGALNAAIPHSSLVELAEVLPGAFWIEHHGYLCGGCGVEVTLECRVYQQQPTMGAA